MRKMDGEAVRDRVARDQAAGGSARSAIADIVSRSLHETELPAVASNATIGEGFEVPPRLLGESEFHWFHPPLQGTAYLCVLSATVTWYAGHYQGGRMRACDGDGCEACLLGLGRQVRYVVCCVNLESRQIGFLEVGVAQGDMLRRIEQDRGGIRNAVLTLGRVSRKKNARIEMDVLNEEAPVWAKDLEALNVQTALFQTWSRARARAPLPAHD